MGRLFWKVFFGFWLTMLTIASVAALAVFTAQKAQLEDLDDSYADSDDRVGLMVGRRAQNAIARQAVVLQYGGESALRDMLLNPDSNGEARRQRPSFPRLRNMVRVTNSAGVDLLNRKVPEHTFEIAKRRLSEASPAVQQVTSREGNQFFMFVPQHGEPLRNRPVRPWYQRVSPLAIGASGLVFSMLFSGLLAWYMARPIRALRNGFKRVACGELDTRVAGEIGSRRDELADLGTHFDQTIERLQQLIQSQQRLMHDVSHELRSPLARIQAAIGILQQNPDRTDQMLARVERESGRLDQLVGEILTLSRLDEPSAYGAQETFDLDDLIADITSDARFEARERDLTIAVAGTAGDVRGYPNLLHRAIENLVRNAVKYSDKAGEILVTVERNLAQVRITVRDNGPGIPDNQLETIIEPFVRLPDVRIADDNNKFRPESHDSNGFGLGLAITKRAMDIHHGKLQLANHPQGGLIATISFPQNPIGTPVPVTTG
ncbi:MAG: ATP-binding protein [Burkholderiaceae bacterium]